MTDSQPPRPDGLHDETPADSSGLPWQGRVLASTGFDGDLGEADTNLLAALDDSPDETTLVRAVARARLFVPFVPMVSVPHVVEGSGELIGHGQTGPGAEQITERATDMAVVTLTAPDGERAFPVFSSLALLSAWDATARPSPVTGSRAAQGAVTERCDVMLIDCGSAHERLLRPSMVWALAQQRDWLPAHADPFVAQTLVRATADEDDVVTCVGEPDPVRADILRVVLSLRPGLGSAEVQALATRVGEAIATDGEARARIDGLSFTIVPMLLT